jgi:hypothetical protein
MYISVFLVCQVYGLLVAAQLEDAELEGIDFKQLFRYRHLSLVLHVNHFRNVVQAATIAE